jgi:hypothetical protein
MKSLLVSAGVLAVLVHPATALLARDDGGADWGIALDNVSPTVRPGDDFYRSHAEMERRNALGITPIASTLPIIGGRKDRAGFVRIMAYPWMNGLDHAGRSFNQ